MKSFSTVSAFFAVLGLASAAPMPSSNTYSTTTSAVAAPAASGSADPTVQVVIALDGATGRGAELRATGDLIVVADNPESPLRQPVDDIRVIDGTCRFWRNADATDLIEFGNVVRALQVQVQSYRCSPNGDVEAAPEAPATPEAPEAPEAPENNVEDPTVSVQIARDSTTGFGAELRATGELIVVAENPDSPLAQPVDDIRVNEGSCRFWRNADATDLIEFGDVVRALQVQVGSYRCSL